MWASLSSVRPTQVPFSHCVSSLRLKPGGSMGTLIITVSAKFTKADLYTVPVRDSKEVWPRDPCGWKRVKLQPTCLTSHGNNTWPGMISSAERAFMSNTMARALAPMVR